jgi:Spy/CpxP family protein refolding chaperone
MLKLITTLKFSLVSGALVLASAGSPLQAQRLPEAMTEAFYPPDLIRQTRQMIGLTDEQQASLQEAVEKIQTRVTSLQRQYQLETERMSALVKAEKLDEDAVMAQADRVLKLEREVKLAELALLIKIKNTLTQEQQAKLRELKAKTAAFRAQLREAQRLAEEWKRDGRDLSKFEQAKEDFEVLLQQGKIKEAETLLDQNLKRLKEPKH